MGSDVEANVPRGTGDATRLTGPRLTRQCEVRHIRVPLLSRVTQLRRAPSSAQPRHHPPVGGFRIVRDLTSEEIMPWRHF